MKILIKVSPQKIMGKIYNVQVDRAVSNKELIRKSKELSYGDIVIVELTEKDSLDNISELDGNMVDIYIATNILINTDFAIVGNCEQIYQYILERRNLNIFQDGAENVDIKEAFTYLVRKEDTHVQSLVEEVQKTDLKDEYSNDKRQKDEIEIKRLKTQLDWTTQEFDSAKISYENSISKLKSEVDELRLDKEKLKSIANQTEDMLHGNVEELEIAISNWKIYGISVSKLIELCNDKIANVEYLREKDKNTYNNDLANEINKLAEEKNTLIADNLDEINRLKEHYNTALDSFNQKYESLEKDLSEKIGSYKNDIASLKLDIETKDKKLDASIKNFELLNKQYDEVSIYKQEEINKLTIENNKLSLNIENNLQYQKDLEEKLVIYGEIEEENSKLKNDNNQLQINNNKLKVDYKMIEEQINLLTSEDKGLKKALENRTTAMSDNVEELKEEIVRLRRVRPSKIVSLRTHDVYKSHNKLIAINGSGGYGTTTVVTSLVDELAIKAKKILVIDFDLISPTLDGWYNVSPILNGLTDIYNKQYRTSLGALASQGMEFVSNNFENIIIPISKYIHYFSGIINSAIDIENIARIDFDKLMQFISYLPYEYIVVDLGRIGNNVINDCIIKTICMSADKVVTVTNADKFNIRNSVIKIKNFEIPQEKHVWVSNLASKNGLDPTVKSILGIDSHINIKFEIELHNTRKYLGSSKTTKIAFQEIVKHVI